MPEYKLETWGVTNTLPFFFFFFTSSDICWVLSSFVAGGCEARPNNLRGGMRFPAENSKHGGEAWLKQIISFSLKTFAIFFKLPGKGGLKVGLGTWRTLSRVSYIFLGLPGETNNWQVFNQNIKRPHSKKGSKQDTDWFLLTVQPTQPQPNAISDWLKRVIPSLPIYLHALQWEINASGASLVLSLLWTAKN